MKCLRVVELAAAITACCALHTASAEQDTWVDGDLEPSSDLVEHTDAQLGLCIPRNVGYVDSPPIPTNKWWGNLVTCDPGTNITMPVWAQPFTVMAEMVSSDALYGYSMGYPFRNRYSGNPSADGQVGFYGHAVHKEVIFSATEFKSSTPQFNVTGWSDHGVTTKMAASSSKALESSIVSGMAYFTAKYTALTPRVMLQVPILTINNAGVSVGRTIQGRKFIVHLVNGGKWVFYASQEVTLVVKGGQELQLSAALTGTLRVAPILDTTPISFYDLYKDCIVEGGDVNILSDTQYEFNWQTSGDCSGGLLHYALLHQRESIDPTSVREVEEMVIHSTTRGQMYPLVTAPTTAPRWLLNEEASLPITFYPRRRLTAKDASDQGLLEQLTRDIASTWTIARLGSFYSNGKVAQKFASLCLMANDPVIVGKDLTILRLCLTKLEDTIAPFLENSWVNKLVYDNIFGGIVSSESFTSGDLNADYGNSVYNDHHYHFGYWIYTAAVINYLHPTWSRLDELNDMTRLLLRDVATPSNDDPYFPKFRHFDWYRGNSYSHGVTTFADGKDQESTSEDVNFSYALYLFGHATGHARMTEIGKIMVKLNARSIQRYFLMENASKVHPENFKSHKAPGIFFDNKVDYATWFSGERFCIHGIQMIPATPVTDYVRTRTFVAEEWDEVLAHEAIVKNSEINNPWLSLLSINYARINKAEALPLLQKMNLDDGLSRSWALYMASQLY